jgi:hypothetical protein
MTESLIDDTTIIGEIAVAMAAHAHLAAAGNPDGSRLTSFQSRRSSQTHYELARGAIHRFGAINGWHTGPEVHSFNVASIGKRSGPYCDHLSSGTFDHPVWYRGGGKCAAIVGQPYPHTDDDADALAFAAKHGVACHIPPCARACFHYPGSCLFYVFTSPEHQIVWLPEQIRGIAP